MNLTSCRTCILTLGKVVGLVFARNLDVSGCTLKVENHGAVAHAAGIHTLVPSEIESSVCCLDALEIDVKQLGVLERDGLVGIVNLELENFLNEILTSKEVSLV